MAPVNATQKRTLTTTSLLDEGRMKRYFAENRWKECHLKRVWRGIIQEGARTPADFANMTTIGKAVVAGLSRDDYQVFTTTVREFSPPPPRCLTSGQRLIAHDPFACVGRL